LVSLTNWRDFRAVAYFGTGFADFIDKNRHLPPTFAPRLFAALCTWPDALPASSPPALPRRRTADGRASVPASGAASPHALPWRQYVLGAAGLTQAPPAALLETLWNLSYRADDDAGGGSDAAMGEVPMLRSREELADLFALAFALAAAATPLASSSASSAVAAVGADAAGAAVSPPSSGSDGAPYSLRETDARRLADAVHGRWRADGGRPGEPQTGAGGVAEGEGQANDVDGGRPGEPQTGAGGVAEGEGQADDRALRELPFEAFAAWCGRSAPCLQLCLRAWAFGALLQPAGLDDAGPSARFALPTLRAAARAPGGSTGNRSSITGPLQAPGSGHDAAASPDPAETAADSAAAAAAGAPSELGREVRSAVLFDSPGGAASGLFGLSLHGLECQATWRQLYASPTDGLSFHRVAHALQGYPGPCVLLLEDQCGSVFGAFCSSGFKPGNTFAGGSSANFMFR
jgi:hypothetical protein